MTHQDVTEGAKELFVHLGGRGSNRGLIYIITQSKLVDGERVHRFVVRMEDGASLKTVPDDWRGVPVVYTGTAESLPEF